MAGQPHRLRANRMPPLVPVAQFHPVGRDAGDPEPAPAPRHLHPSTHPNSARGLGPLGRRGRSYPATGGVRGWAPRRIGLGADRCARRLSPHSAQIGIGLRLRENPGVRGGHCILQRRRRIMSCAAEVLSLDRVNGETRRRAAAAMAAHSVSDDE